MNLNISISRQKIERLSIWLEKLNAVKVIGLLSFLSAFIASAYSFRHGYIIAYGDAESHLNISKRIIDSLTPGFAQLGGIWLPLPHLLLVPFVSSNFLWRTGIAGSIVSGICFIIASIFLYKTTFLLTKNKLSSFISAIVFMSNPNILYVQSTPLTEMTLIVFFILSSYYFIVFLEDRRNILAFLASSFFGFCAALSRYDGWSLVLMEAGIIVLLYLPWKKIPRSFGQIKEYWDSNRFSTMEGRLFLFCTLAFSGILVWLGWDWLILGDPLYFTHSVFSAKSQQASWLARGELPAYHNLWQSFLYYFVTCMGVVGVLLFIVALIGLFYYLFSNSDKRRWYIFLILLVPFIFNVATLYLGQSIVFVPDLTPGWYLWNIFNVRYGTMMLPLAALCIGYLFYKTKTSTKWLIILVLFLQLGLYGIGYTRVLTLQDGLTGGSSSGSKLPDAQRYLAENYKGGMLLEDDYSRTISLIRINIRMQDVIYIGNAPYYKQSLVAPERYATWIVMQNGDDVWTHLYSDLGGQGRLYKYFIKVYTSPDILIFRRNPAIPESDTF